ncbi:MAG: aminoacetone oxidase family FAD-binding enzyme [bacterium]
MAEGERRGSPAPRETAERALVVIGAGAAGLLAATFAARDGADVLLLESSEKPGAKIRVSGGGRCNLLPSAASVEDFWTYGSYPALRNVVFAWPLAEVRAHFEQRLGIALVDEPTGKVFPKSGNAREVSEALLADCARAGVELRAGTRVAGVRMTGKGPARRFDLETAAGEHVLARRVILATGGLSLPKTGSDGAGYRFARALGHTVRHAHPALVPLLSKDPTWGELAGVSVPVVARAVRDGRVLEQREGDLLFTHRGFSGPVVLDLSRHFAGPGGDGVELRIEWGAASGPEWDRELLTDGARLVATTLRERLPRRLADRLLARASVSEDTRASSLRREVRRRLVETLSDGPLDVAGTEGFRTAEVTGGGIPLEEIRPRTLESRPCPGLHLAGEMLDATGRLGGYNFLWAWVSGRLAGLGAAAALASVSEPGESSSA